MASTVAHVSWAPSVSTDVRSQKVELLVNGSLVAEVELPVAATTTDFDVSEVVEGAVVEARVTAFDGTNRSAPGVGSAVVPDITAPEAPTDVVVTFG